MVNGHSSTHQKVGTTRKSCVFHHFRHIYYISLIFICVRSWPYTTPMIDDLLFAWFNLVFRPFCLFYSGAFFLHSWQVDYYHIHLYLLWIMLKLDKIIILFIILRLYSHIMRVELITQCACVCVHIWWKKYNDLIHEVMQHTINLV